MSRGGQQRPFPEVQGHKLGSAQLKSFMRMGHAYGVIEWAKLTGLVHGLLSGSRPAGQRNHRLAVGTLGWQLGAAHSSSISASNGSFCPSAASSAARAPIDEGGPSGPG